MASKIAMLGSYYLESKLYKTWPILTHVTCAICGEKFRRQWLWKFLRRRKYALERQEYQYACYDCASDNYNDAVTAIDKHYRVLTFSMWHGRPPASGSGVKPPR